MPKASALWLSIFGEYEWVFEGLDAADRLLDALAATVIVIDADGFPDAYYIAETAIHTPHSRRARLRDTRPRRPGHPERLRDTGQRFRDILPARAKPFRPVKNLPPTTGS